MAKLSESELERTLATIVERLRDALAPIAIYLFGSYVYGDPDRDSDIDLLVVVEDSGLSAYERDAAADRALRGIRRSIDVQVYTRAEFETRAALPVSFERTVARKGRLIHAA